MAITNEGLNYSQELLFARRIVDLRTGKFPRLDSDRMLSASFGVDL
jgi:hypothetical protein